MENTVLQCTPEFLHTTSQELRRIHISILKLTDILLHRAFRFVNIDTTLGTISLRSKFHRDDIS